ncbi:GtrA family protein [Streptomyces sp. FH025]|uniref:GtrA family protein n=1 Tax=Streptomyces sp. FH025 TaxID=2815937 RepID=UPI001A9EA412|nr:GtrA family protein [Streptomyces sp. FH025]MBO1413412.1 GtrA family protein [Streptomyces sp. FH025]
MTQLESPADVSESSAKGRIAALLGHSAVRFLAAGVTSTAVDMGLLFVLHGVLKLPLAPSTLVAVLAGFTTNFLLNRIWAFESSSPVGKQTARYMVMAGGNWLGTVLLVGGFVKLGLFYLLARAIALVILSVVNYFGYKYWVFRDK